MEKNTLTRSLMAGSIVLVLVLQGFWLKSSYRDAREAFEQKTEFLFRATVMHLQDSLIRENIELVPDDSLGTFSGKEFSDSIPSLVISRSALNSAPDSSRIAIMIPPEERKIDAVFSELREERVTRYFVLREADSLRVGDVRREYRQALAKAGVLVPFQVIKVPFDTATGHRIPRFPALKGKFSRDGMRMFFLEEPKTGTAVVKAGHPAADSPAGVSAGHPAIAAARSRSLRRELPGGEKGLTPFPEDGDILAAGDAFHAGDTFHAGKVFRDGHVFIPQTGILSVQFDKAGYRWILLRELTPQLLFSVVMVLFIGISFYFMYRSLRMQQRLMLLKNDFVGNMTHELKTPVATASVAIEALRNFKMLKDPERTREYLEIAQNELNRLTLLTDNILKAAAFESKGIDLRVETIELKELIGQVLASMKLVFEKKQAEVSFHTEGEDFRAEGGKAHIVNVFYNLLDNALKYSPGNPRIIVRLKSLKDGILLNIRDNGIGIPQEFHEKVFEKFFRVPSGDVHNIKGHGLGLNYVAGVVKSHGGTIRLDSQPGSGSTFILYLPRRYEKN